VNARPRVVPPLTDAGLFTLTPETLRGLLAAHPAARLVVSPDAQ
jgi:hypothetical protein